jgi:two-component system sensor histidine kinase/response regulator
MISSGKEVELMTHVEGANVGRAAIFLVAMAVLLATMACMPSLSPGSSQRELLVLHSYHQGYKWTDDVSRGIAAAVRDGGKAVKVHYEYMDTKRLVDAGYLRLLSQSYRYKFRNSRFDAIIASDNDAFNFLLTYRDDLFPGTPVVFCGVNYFQPSQLHGARLFTGVNEVADIKATLDIALKLHPKTRQIAVINDTTTTGRIVHNEIMHLIPAYRERVKFVFLEDAAMPEILAAVRKLPADSLVFYSFFFRDKAGRLFDYDESISLIAQNCPVPIYGIWDFNLGYGIVGGMLTSGYYQGATAGAMALRILQGEKVENIPVVMESPNRYMFDYRQLERFRIDLAALPKGSILINRPMPLYSVHRAIFWGALVALAGLVAVIAFLLRNMAIRRRTEEVLRTAAVKYRIVADNTYDWEFWLSPEKRFLYSSPSCRRITGHDAEEFLADPGLLQRIIHPDDQTRFREHRHEITQNMAAGELEFRIVRPDGSVRWLEHLCQPVFDDNGQFLGKRGSNRDITARKLTDDALRESEERYRTLFEGANDAIVTIRNGNFVDCNRKALDMFRCTAAEFAGRPPEYFSPPLQPDGRESVEKAREEMEAALAGSPQIFEWHHRRCDGALFHAEVSLNRVECHGTVELQAVIRDISERKEMERMKDEVISAVSHEMRTPLTAMLGFTEFLLANEVDPAQQKDYLRIVHGETERLSELIGTFLDLQRMKARQVTYKLKPLAVGPLLEEAAALFAGASKTHRVTLLVPQELPPVIGDETRLHQVLNNLLSNAIKYSPLGGEVILGARRDADAVTIWVKDQGIGILPEAQERIFERFYRVDGSDRRATGGTGLGLALVQEIVHVHRGRVWVESVAGEGSTFFVSLPIGVEAPGAGTEGRPDNVPA